MTPALWQALLAQATAETIETMALLATGGEPDPPAPTGGVAAGLRFAGDVSGEFALELSPEAAVPVAANFLGVLDETEVTPKQVEQVVCELANVICGRLLSSVSDVGTFRLDPPVRRLGAWPEGMTQVRALEQGLLRVGLRLESAG